MRDLRAIPDWEERYSCHVVAAAVVGGTAAIGGAVISGSAAQNASQTQANAANNAAAVQQQMYNQTRQDLLPYNQEGQSANALLGQLNGVGGNSASMQSTLEGLPGYQFTLQQGEKGVQNSAAARGLGVSGAALKDAATYGTGLANSTYTSYANQLLGQAGLGENAAAMTGNNATATGANIGNSLTGAANASAAGTIGTANAISGGLSGVSNSYLQSQFLNNLMGGGSSNGGFFGSPAAYNNTLSYGPLDLTSLAGGS